MDKPQYAGWDDVAVGVPSPPVQFTLTAEVVEKYVQAAEDFNPVYLDERAARAEGWDARIAPPTAATIWVIHAAQATLGLRATTPGRIHAKQSYEFHRPARIGDTLTTVITTVDKYIRRERRYSINESVTTNQDGELVVIGRMTVIWPF
ncbi:MAG: hypothetical protein EPO21_09015 [Chloroflexota bacterium]|nr:MAG: hypothetical protein EPO21_09015 [Chloroflexota bacterium]